MLRLRYKVIFTKNKINKHENLKDSKPHLNATRLTMTDLKYSKISLW